MNQIVDVPSHMRAVVYHGPKNLRVEIVPVPEIEPDEMLVKVRSATTCGTDVKTYLRGHPKYPPPFLFGHEFSGDVVRVGSMVKGFEPGARVTASCFGPCGSCYHCKHLQENLCENMSYNFATYAEYLRLTGPFVRRNTLIVPENLSYSQAAMLEPLSSVIHGHKLLKILPGESVVILGSGSVGLMHLQLAKARGAAEIILVDNNPKRLGYALELGATNVINAKELDPIRIVKEYTSGYGADVAIEAAGVKTTWETAPRMTRKGGRVLWFGGLPAGTEVILDGPAIHYGEITLLNTHGNAPADFWEACNLVSSGIVKTDFLLSGEMPLEEIEKALQWMSEGRIMKVSINPTLPYPSISPESQ